MPSFKKTQSNFSLGVISPDFFARNIAGSLSVLENVFVNPTGVLQRRPGTRQIGQIPNQNAIIIPFGAEFLLVLTQRTLLIYKDDQMYQGFVLNWDITDLNQVQWVQRFDTMIFVHPDNPPRILRQEGHLFSFADFQFARDSERMPILPFMRFPDTENVSITLETHPSGTNWARATASAPIWTQENLHGHLLILGRKFRVAEVISPTVIDIAAVSSFTRPNTPIEDWREAAFSNRRGWPRSITFHQDRLVFGGSRGWPSGLWLSRTGDHHNFDVGTGLDDEAIFITLLSQTEQRICTTVSSRDLQVMTDSGEWAISANPMTPSNMNARQHTGIGTDADRFVPPQKINGNTVFISKQEIRELALDELGENYNANDLSIMARHLVDVPRSMAYSPELSQLFVVMQNGAMAVLTKQPITGIQAWSVYKTNGKFLSVGAQKGRVFIIVERNDERFLEVFDPDIKNDKGECDFEWRIAGAPMVVENHLPRKIRINSISVRADGIRHLNIMGRDIYFKDPFVGDAAGGSLGTTSHTISAPWEIKSDQQFDAKILSITVNGHYEI